MGLHRLSCQERPHLQKPADRALVGADPVTGRNQQIDLSWEQLCLSTAYQLQVAKDMNFTIRINPEISNATHINAVTGSILLRMDSVNMTSPAAWLSPASLPEAGAYILLEGTALPVCNRPDRYKPMVGDVVFHSKARVHSQLPIRGYSCWPLITDAWVAGSGRRLWHGHPGRRLHYTHSSLRSIRVQAGNQAGQYFVNRI